MLFTLAVLLMLRADSDTTTQLSEFKIFPNLTITDCSKELDHSGTYQIPGIYTELYRGFAAGKASDGATYYATRHEKLVYALLVCEAQSGP